MPKNTASSSVVEATQAVPESNSKTKDGYGNSQTNWGTFDKVNLGVSQIICSTLPGHPGDEACKTRLVPTAKSVISHLEHGGGFIFTIRPAEKPWQGWAELADKGVNIRWIRDEVTDNEVSINGRSIVNLLKPHQGKFRGAYQAFHNQFLFFLSYQKAEPVGDDETPYVYEPIVESEQ